MACTARIHHWLVPHTNITLAVCDDCLDEACNELRVRTPTERIAFARFMDDLVPQLDFDSLKEIEEELSDRFSDYLVLYLAYEKTFGEGIEEDDAQ